MRDSQSIYELNNAEFGAGVTIIKDSVYNGTEIRFDFNEANASGGAVFATT